jgi:uncharacterized damage-inducible protein DinB
MLIPQGEHDMKPVATSALFVLLGALVALPAAAQTTPTAPAARTSAAGQAPTDPASTAFKTGFDNISRNLTESAAKMPEENFSFKPTPDVRSFGQLLGHVANSHYSYCSRIKGEPNPNAGKDLEQVTAKADLVKALNDSVEYCKAVYGAMTDARLMTPTTPTAPPPGATGAQAAPPRPMVPFNVLLQNLTHDWEHYGNVVTYLRLKGLVPPSTERTQKK